MSVEKVVRKKGTAWRVRWNDEQGRPHAKVVGRKADAILLDSEIKRKKRLGDLAELDAGTDRLATFVRRWWDEYATANLAPRTRESYLYNWDKWIEPDLGQHRLKDLTPAALDAWVASLRAREVGNSVIYRALAILQGVLQRAVEWGELKQNPVRLVRKPRVQRQRVVRAVPGNEIEALLLKGDDVALVTLFMTYAGLRPAELRALTWEDIGEHVIVVDKAVDADGSIKDTKTYAPRTVPIRPELRFYIAQHRSTGPVFGHETDNQWRAFVRNHWPADFPPYDLRHTYASKLIHDGHSLIEVASWMGNDPAITARIYAHMFEEALEDRRQDAA